MDNNRLKYNKAPVLEGIEGLSHGFFQRDGGTSAFPFNSLNISYDVGDDEDRVTANRKIIMDEFSTDRMVAVNQVHGSRHYIPGPGEGKSHKRINKEADIIISDNPGQLLLIKTADCQPVLIADEDKRVCAAIHSGWRGSVKNVILRAIDLMVVKYNCYPEDMKAAIGPSLGPCCAEFVNYRKEIPEEYWPYRVGEYHFDFWEISRYQLKMAGLSEKNIWMDKRCTKCNPDSFFSYRESKETGRQGAVIGWLS